MITFTPAPEGLSKIREAFFDATDETSEEIKEHAKDLAFFGKYETGETRESIFQETTATAHGVKSKIFTTSGHGGYVEVGGHPKSKMKAEPFMYPAFSRTIQKFFDNVRARLS
jgi:hypothetical protein